MEFKLEPGMANLYANDHELFLSQPASDDEYDIFRIAISREGIGKPKKIGTIPVEPFAMFSVDEVLRSEQIENDVIAE